MARPIKFAEATSVENFAHGHPSTALPVEETKYSTVSCWQLSPEEIAEVQKTGVIWLSTQLVGKERIQSAVALGADKNEIRAISQNPPG